MLFGNQVPLHALSFLAPRFYKRNVSNDRPEDVQCFHSRLAKIHASGNACVVIEGGCSVAITCDLTWPNLPRSKRPYSRGANTNSPAPRVDRQKDDHDEVDDHDEPGFTDKVSPRYTTRIQERSPVTLEIMRMMRTW